jgi:hypothetical protein
MTTYKIASTGLSLRSDRMAHWIQTEWLPTYPHRDATVVFIPNYCLEVDVLTRIASDFALPDGYFYTGRTQVEADEFVRIGHYDQETSKLNFQTGVFVYHFKRDKDAATNGSADKANEVDILVMGAFYEDDNWYRTSMAAIPQWFLPIWAKFAKECSRLSSAIVPRGEVIIIGGRNRSFLPKVEWDDIVLPAQLKAELQEDARSFFTKGVDVYKRLNLKPFRKLMLAGVPGTGKTMICSALAKWALDEGYLVIYISSAVRGAEDDRAAAFGKVLDALSIAADSQHPTLILLEEIDAYLHDDEKALLLNVLDGSEAEVNEFGTLLVATTNHPEVIDERVLKRPGRLDRIFIVPETRSNEDAEQMLQHYLGSMWKDEHRALVPKLVGYPGSFIREVAIYALTQIAYDDLDELSLDLLEKSFKGLKEQIDARNDFLSKRASREFGYGGA